MWFFVQLCWTLYLRAQSKFSIPLIIGKTRSFTRHFFCRMFQHLNFFLKIENNNLVCNLSMKIFFIYFLSISFLNVYCIGNKKYLWNADLFHLFKSGKNVNKPHTTDVTSWWRLTDSDLVKILDLKFELVKEFTLEFTRIEFQHTLMISKVLNLKLNLECKVIYWIFFYFHIVKKIIFELSSTMRKLSIVWHLWLMA